MKKTTKCLLCSILFVILVCCGFACREKKAKVDFQDFEDKEVELEIGEKYLPDYVKVLDEDGQEYLLNDSLYITAQDADGKEVPITNGSFTVMDFEGYTVFYRVYVGDDVYERKVRVKVKDTTKPNVSIYNFRTEYELGYIPVPSFYIHDNSGEDLNISYYEFYDSTGETLLDESYFEEIEYNGKKVIEAKQTGEYILRAQAQDFSANGELVEKRIVISAKKADGVWEDFSSPNSVEGVKTSSLLTSQNEVQYFETFEEADGVVEIQAPFKEYWGYGQNIQISLAKIPDDIYDCNWSSFTVRAYFVASESETKVKVQSNGEDIGEYPTNQWVDIEIKSSQFLLDTAGNLGMSEDTALDIRYYNFANSITSNTPAPILTLFTNGKATDSVIKTYIDCISWTEAVPDEEAPTISFTSIKTVGLVGSTLKLPTVKVLDNIDAINQYEATITDPSGNTSVASGSTINLKEAGLYTFEVKATDFAGNTATSTLTITAVESLDANNLPIATYDAADTLATTATNAQTTEWLESYDGKDGVAKYTFAAGQNVVQMGFSSQDWALTEYRYYYDFIKLNVRFEFVKEGTTYDSNTKIGLTSGASWINRDSDFAVGEWKELTLYTKDFCSRGTSTYITKEFSNATSEPYHCSQGLYNMLNNGVANNLFGIAYPYAGENYSITTDNIQVIMYIDSVSIGMDTEGPVIDDTALTKTGTAGEEFSLNAISITDNSDNSVATNSSAKTPYCVANFGIDDKKGGCEYKVYKLVDGEKDEEQAVSFTVDKTTRNVFFTPTEAGEYVVEVKAKDFAGNETAKSIEITINN